MRTHLIGFAAAALLAGALAGCASDTPGGAASASSDARGCITNFQQGTDYFPDKVTFDDATGVSVSYQDYYKVVEVAQPSPGTPPATFVLVQCGAPEPELSGDLAGATKVTIPVERIAAASTTQVPGLQMLDAAQQVVGVSDGTALQDGPVKTGVDDGRIVQFGNTDGSVNVERVLGVEPDVFLASGMEDASVAKLRELGVSVVPVAEWLEKTPLGRAEWLKFYSLLLDKEASATSQYADIADGYHEVATKVAGANDRPKVLMGMQFQGTWYVPGSDTYQAAYLADAGSDYAFAGPEYAGSPQVAMETVLATAGDAQYWLNGTTMNDWTSLADVLAADERYGSLKAVQDSQVWVPTLRINATGGNDYWEQGVVRPDLVLADLAAIFHPDLMPDHEFTFYQQLK